MLPQRTLSRDEWLVERKQLLAQEKELTRLRDEVSRARRALPWVKVEKKYVFEGPDGPESLGDLFEGRSQLVVYHFMFAPDWTEGCPSCSYTADHFDAMLIHLEHRDVTLLAISRASWPHIEAYRKRMGWKFKWLSSLGNDFNGDYGVLFTPECVVDGKVTYNYVSHNYVAGYGMLEDGHGVSVFSKDADGTVYHTYSTYARGTDMLVGTYNFLDLVPKGRDEEGFAFPMTWLRRHDEYDYYKVDAKAGYPMPAKADHACCAAHDR